MSQENKSKSWVVIVLSPLFLPFIMILNKAIKKGLDEPATMKDLLVIFGLQLGVATLILIKIFFFSNAMAVLGR